MKYNTVTLVLRASKISDDIQCMNPSLTPQSELGQANEQPLQKTDQRSNTVEEKYLNMDASSGLGIKINTLHVHMYTRHIYII